MTWFKRKSPKEEEKIFIIEKMDRAIKVLEERAEYRKNAMAGYCIRHLSARLEEISNDIIANMTTTRTIHSKPYRIEDIFGNIEFDDLFSLKGNANDNSFSEYLAENKLTMAIDERHEYVMFAYGRHACFHSHWLEFAGYDY